MRAEYRSADEAREAVGAAFQAVWEPTIDHTELLLAVRDIVSKAYRSGVEHGLALGSRHADEFADAAFAKGFAEGQMHGIVLADVGTVCENHLELDLSDDG